MHYYFSNLCGLHDFLEKEHAFSLVLRWGHQHHAIAIYHGFKCIYMYDACVYLF
jgi:hypothetical protein